MKVTVRTLDSKSTTFDVDDEATVKQFKEKVAPELGIPVESQRIIFKGKVLHDEKLMKDYNVDGCVVHLVQRAPPSTTQPSSTESRGTSASLPRGPHDHQPNVFIGAFQGSNEITNVTQQLVENLLSSFGTGAHGAATVTTSSIGNGTAVNVQINMQGDHQNASHNDAQQRLSQAQKFLASARTGIQNLQINTSSPSAMDVDESTAKESSTPPSSSTSNAANSEQSQPTVNNTPQSLANTIKDFQDVYSQLEPSLQRYRELLTTADPQTRTASNDNLPDGIAEIFHNLSHSMHALSDLTFNFHAPEPQSVSCLPRLSPVNMPQSASAPQTASTASSTQPQNAATPSTDAGGVPSQPHFHVQPHVHVHQHSHGPMNGSQHSHGNVGPHDFGNVNISRPIGVSATVIQIPRFPTAQGMPQTSTTASNTPSSAAPPIFSLPNLFPPFTAMRPAGMPNTSQNTSTTRSSNNSSTTAAGETGANVTAPSSSTSSSSSAGQSFTTASLPRGGLPFGLNPLNPGVLAGHPDPLVPCQSFHFGPRFQQTNGGATDEELHHGRQIVAEVSGVMIEHVPTDGPHSHAPTANATQNGQAAPSSAPETQSTQSTISATSGPANAFFGQNVPTNILADIFAQHFQQQQQQQQQHSNPQQQQPHADDAFSSDDDFDIDDNEEFIDINDSERAYAELYRAVINTLAESEQSNQSIREFLQNIFGDYWADETDERPNDVMFHTMNFLAEHLSVHDIIRIVVGGFYEPIIRIAPDILRFLETKFNGGERITEQNIPQVTESIITSFNLARKNLESSSNKPDIDLLATLTKIDTEFCKEALALLINQESPSFVDESSALLKRYLPVLVAVLDHCLTGGLETYINTFTGNHWNMRVYNPEYHELLTSGLVRKIRSVIQNEPQLSTDELQKHLINKKGEVKKDAQLKDQATAADRPIDVDAEAREKINVDQLWREMNSGMQTNHDNDEDDDHNYRSSSEYHEWHRHVPPEWIAVITRDVKRQRLQPVQRPFSDAYYNGLPPKRRRAFETGPSTRGVNVTAALQNAIASANVQPLTNDEELSNDLEKEELSEAFMNSFRADARRHLQEDPDFKPSKYPKSNEYYFQK
eukprot:gene15878-17478_t